jgi:sulfate transport system ATP-binding protein
LQRTGDGEFGAVYVVSGHIAGRTDTMPLRIEKLFQEYNLPGSFAVASLLCLLALVTLVVKTALQWQTRREIEGRRREALPDATEVSPARPLFPPPAALPRVAASKPSVQDHRVGISVKNVTKRFGEFVAVDRVSLEVPHGSLLALLGPSGSGKTTLLRVISGLDVPDDGSIHYEDEDATHRAARDRNVGFVFQHYALFRHMSVFENVAFGLRVRRWPEAKVHERVHELLRLVQLDGLGAQAPSQLSGGQRQRVALARALAAEPKVLLLDEPFGALDAKVRKELRQWLRRLHDQIHVTSVFVTHDQEEAFEVADQVVVMNHGRIEQVGTPQEVFDNPASPFVMDFLGNVNVFHGRVALGRASLGGFEISVPDYPHDDERPATAYVRPHDLEIHRFARPTGSQRAEVVRVQAAGPSVKIELATLPLGVTVRVELTQERFRELELKAGERVFVSPKQARVFVQDFQI